MVRRPRKSAPNAFTLLELVLVLVIISVTLAMAAPSLQGWSRGMKMRNATDDLLRATRGARNKAVTEATPCRLYLEPKDGRYWLMSQDGADFVNVDTSYGREQKLADGLHLEFTKTVVKPKTGIDTPTLGGSAANSADQYIEFSPTGRTEPAVIKITSDYGDSDSIQCVSPAEPFRRVMKTEGSR